MAADAIIIGAGIIGTSIAWRLAQGGTRVILLDTRQAGGEASWAGAGMLAPGGEVTERNEWSDFALHSRALYPDFIAELREITGCSIDFQVNGAIEVAATEAEWLTLQERAQRQRLLGVLSSSVTPASPDKSGALFYPDDAAVDPRDVMRALLAACRSSGVTILEHTRALAIGSSRRSVEVETPEGSLSAAAGVLAAGAWSGGIPFTNRGAAQKLPGSFPVRGHLIGYHPGAPVCRTILRHGDTYILQRANGFLIAGSSTENAGFDRHIDPQIVAAIAGRAAALLPVLRQAGPPEAWLGFRPRADAHQPQIGRFGDSNLWLAYGHYRNGILLAPATAERVSAQITSTAGTGWSLLGGRR